MALTDRQIKEALIALLDGIKRSDGVTVHARMEELEKLLAAHRKELHPQLAHFIGRRSYAKALAYVQSGAGEAA